MLFSFAIEGFLRVGFFGFGSTLIDAHSLPGQTEGLRVGCGWVGGGMGSRWLSRFNLIRLRRISLATFAAFGGAHNEYAEVWADGWILIYY